MSESILHLRATDNTYGNPRRLYVEIDAMGCFALSHWDMELLGLVNLTWALAEMMHGVTCVDRINI